jgi:hypothetical protein
LTSFACIPEVNNGGLAGITLPSRQAVHCSGWCANSSPLSGDPSPA